MGGWQGLGGEWLQAGRNRISIVNIRLPPEPSCLCVYAPPFLLPQG